MPLKRTPHWATRELHQFLLDRAETPFSWGTADCCLIAADAILAFTGVDIAADFRGRYTTEIGAWRTVKQVTGGGRSAEDAVAWCAALHDLPEWRFPLQAQRGDLVVLRDGDRLLGGFVHLNGRHAITMGPEGLRRYPLAAVTRAWRV